MLYILLRIITLCALVLLPIIPAYLIFTKFPSRNHVAGPFKGLSLNLTGAFAGYFIVLLISASFIPSIFKAIAKQEDAKINSELFESEKPWTVKAYVKFKNYDNTDLNDDLKILDLLHSLNSQISLPANTLSPNIVISIPRPNYFFSGARQLQFISTQPNWLIQPNGLNYSYIENKMKWELKEVDLDTIIIKLPPPQEVKTDMPPPSGVN